MSSRSTTTGGSRMAPSGDAVVAGRDVGRGCWTVRSNPTTLHRILVEQVAAVLRTAHEAGVIHRDVKSSNVLFDEEGNAFFGDLDAFGGSDGDAFAEAMSDRLTTYRVAQSSCAREDLDQRSDLYAFGMVTSRRQPAGCPSAVSEPSRTGPRSARGPGCRHQAPLLTECPRGSTPSSLDAAAKDRDERFADVDKLLANVPRGLDDPAPGSGAADRATGIAARASSRGAESVQGAPCLHRDRRCGLPWSRSVDGSIRGGTRSTGSGRAAVGRGQSDQASRVRCGRD